MAAATIVSQETAATPAYFIGSYAGTTAINPITFGFKPSAIIAWNRTDGDTLWFWTAASLTTQVSVVLAAATNTATITLQDNGFTLPTDAVINENAKTYDFIAFR